jgi:hypothetical protein
VVIEGTTSVSSIEDGTEPVPPKSSAVGDGKIIAQIELFDYELFALLAAA